MFKRLILAHDSCFSFCGCHLSSNLFHICIPIPLFVSFPFTFLPSLVSLSLVFVFLNLQSFQLCLINVMLLCIGIKGEVTVKRLRNQENGIKNVTQGKRERGDVIKGVTWMLVENQMLP